jgi:Flp pilus assembly protein TadG
MSRAYSVRVVDRRSRRRSPREHERGYVAVVTAIVMTLLLIFTGLAVDVASWYQRSSVIQRAADAAALAGVTGGPTLANEIEIARQSLQRNGFVDGVNGITTEIKPQDGYPNRLQVTITDAKVSGYFSKIFTTPPKIQRSSTSEYVKSISLGSAFNALGTGDIANHLPDSPTDTAGFWLAVSGYCTAKEDGDRLLAHADGTRKAASYLYACDKGNSVTGQPDAPSFANTFDNVDYDASGYAYRVKVPCPTVPDAENCPLTATTPYPITIEAYDPEYSANEHDPNDPLSPIDTRIDRKAVANSQHPFWYGSRVTTTFQVFPPDGTPEDKFDDVAVYRNSFRTCDSALDQPGNPCSQYVGKWVPLYTIPANSPGGNYRVQVHTEANEYEGYGHNSFALRARIGGTWAPCTSIPASTGFDVNCPSVSGEESMSVLADKAGATSDFFLAKLSPASQYRGKKVRVLLWDPGEGAQSIQILPPGSTTPADFRYRTWDPGLSQVNTGIVIKDRAEGWGSPLISNTLVVSGTGPVRDPGLVYPQWALSSRYSQSRYNDRMVALEISVPKSYGRDASGASIPLPDDGWWKIRYNTNTGVVQDRTTWTVTLAGDPVHLIDQAAP